VSRQQEPQQLPAPQQRQYQQASQQQQQWKQQQPPQQWSRQQSAPQDQHQTPPKHRARDLVYQYRETRRMLTEDLQSMRDAVREYEQEMYKEKARREREFSERTHELQLRIQRRSEIVEQVQARAGARRDEQEQRIRSDTTLSDEQSYDAINALNRGFQDFYFPNDSLAAFDAAVNAQRDALDSGTLSTPSSSSSPLSSTTTPLPPSSSSSSSSSSTLPVPLLPDSASLIVDNLVFTHLPSSIDDADLMDDPSAAGGSLMQTHLQSLVQEALSNGLRQRRATLAVRTEPVVEPLVDDTAGDGGGGGGGGGRVEEHNVDDDGSSAEARGNGDNDNENSAGPRFESL